MMMKKMTFTALVLLCTLIIGGSAVSATGSATPAAAPELKLRVGTFVPGEQEQLALPEALRIDAVPTGKAGYYIVQFGGPVQESWKSAVREAGGEILDYIPDYAFKVYMTPAQAAQVNDQQAVIWSGVFHPAYKIDPALVNREADLVKIRTESNADINDVAQAITATGTKIVRQDGQHFVTLAGQAQVEALARVAGIAWLEPYIMYELHNEYGAGVILGANTANGSGYDGSSQIVAITDSGLGTGTAASAHADLPSSRITGIENWSADDVANCLDVIPDGAQDVDTGHGTHTALSIAGDGGPAGEGRGTAPAANLFFQAVEEYVDFSGDCSAGTVDGYHPIGIPEDLSTLFQPAYDAGARVHSNSWGAPASGDYTADSATVDQFMWEHPRMLLTFSAGNEGVDGNSNGVVDNGSIGVPATAKNVLSVGASENDRSGDYACDTSPSYGQSGTCISMGGSNVVGTYFDSWPGAFSTNPLRNDAVAGNAEQMGAFSGRGPTADGRIKPDVVAPGTWVLSGYSSMHQQGYGDPSNPQDGGYQYDGWELPRSETYKYYGGTSMANALGAGGAVVVRDYYQKAHNYSASAALTKATLINSAVDLQDENNDGANDNDFPIPNVHEGWGLINLAAATSGSAQFVDYTAGIETSDSVHYQLNVASGQPLRVTLAWTDYPSSETAAQNLVNDLNLTVTGPGGTLTYLGNEFSGGWSQTGGTADSVNNVENVYVQTPSAGVWTVQVSGANVPNGPQPYALVVDFAQDAAATGHIAGTVTAEIGGAPLSSIEVCALTYTGSNWAYTGSCSYTDANGDYDIGGLFSGNHRVAFRDSNGAYELEHYNNVVDINSAADVTVTTGSTTTNIDAALAYTTQDILLSTGWNIISSAVEPNDPALETVLAGVESNMLLMKNGGGEIYWPGQAINNIGSWDVRDGYHIFMNEPATLSIAGQPQVPGQTPIALPAGWSTVAYLPGTAMPVSQALGTIDSELDLAKDGFGQVYWPTFAVDQIGDMQPGAGYQLYMVAPGTLTYPDS